MDMTLFPTKGNLIAAKNSLRLAKQGYELLDRKRNVLIREMMELMDQAKSVQARISGTFVTAYDALQSANIMTGVSNVRRIGYATPVEDSVKIRTRSVMGVEIPVVSMEKPKQGGVYGLSGTNSALDLAYRRFEEVKQLTANLAEIENAVYRLAMSISKTQKRANSLKNIVIPKYEKITHDIQNALEEKEREEFSRLKVIKHTK